MRLFPASIWRRLHARHFRSQGWLFYSTPKGLEILRTALAEKVLPARGIRAGPEEIMIFPSAMHAVQCCLSLFMKPGERLVVEDPTTTAFTDLARTAGVRLAFVPVDREGIHLGRLARTLKDRRVRALLLTPSHQFPTTATLDYGRRRRLMELVAGRPIWVLEDDYDHEFHYDSPPLPSLKSMDRTNQVVYIGTFSKVLFQSVHLAYAVAHPTVFEGLCRNYHVLAPRITQLVLSDFIREGHYDHHIRLARRIYRSRRDAMAEALKKELPEFRFEVPKGGVRFWVECPPGLQAQRFLLGLQKTEVIVPILDFPSSKPVEDHWFTLGFASADEREIVEGIAVMKRVADAMRRGE